jgi:hypothetical protein
VTFSEFLAALDWTDVLSVSSWVIALYALYKLFRDRHIRATDVLLKLEERFDACGDGRAQIEYAYENVQPHLKAGVRGNAALTGIDDLLRFYIVIYAVRQARQVPDQSLSTCYRYWLAFYYRKDRSELRRYINDVYPTLKQWLLEDAARPARQSFFRPGDFWEIEEYSTDSTWLSVSSS